MFNKMNLVFENDEKIIELCKNSSEILQDLDTFITILINELWKKPQLVASIIEHTNINTFREHLSPFFAHNFYDNILSYDCIEDNLLYVLTLLMQSEIGNLNDINQKDKFLVDTPCGIMFEEIYKNAEVQMYLNKITKNSIDNLERNYSTKEIDLNLKNLANELNSTLSNEMNNDNNRKGDFKQKYIKNLDKSALEIIIAENKNNKNMCDFLNAKLSLISSNLEQKFSNKIFLSFCSGFKNSDKLLNLYKNNFYIAIDFIEQIINDILNEIHSIPNSLKKICRIISELITQKFPTINTIDKNAFIKNFFVDKLLIPFLLNGNIYSFISDNTIFNLKIICRILKQCINGDFFSSDDFEFSFTPFNWFTIYNMKNIIIFYQNLTNVQLSPYLENLINNKLSHDFDYDYFNENPDKIFYMKSILYNTTQMKELITTIENNKNINFSDKKYLRIIKSIERIHKNNNMNLMEQIINDEKKDINRYNQTKNNKKEKKKGEELPKPKIRYFLRVELCFNKKYDRYSGTRSGDYFFIKPNKESKEENDIIKFKNYLIYLLHNSKQLEKSDFNENELNNIERIINRLYCSLSDLEINDDYFSKLCAEYILETLKNLPDDSRENYLMKILNELEKEINESIQETDFGIFAIINRILKSNKGCQANYRKYLEILEKYEANNEFRKIIKEYFIPIDVTIDYIDDEISKFEIKTSSFKEKEKEKEDKIKKYEKSNKVKLCFYIEDFPKIFPDFSKYQSNDDNDEDIFEIQGSLQVPKELNKYINIIKEKLIRIYNITKLEEILDKIYDYIIEKIYDKSFPMKPYKKDKEIYRKCISLDWIQPHQIINKKDLDFLGKSEKDIVENIKLFIQEKSMQKKNKSIKKILNSIELLFQFDKMSTKYRDVGFIERVPEFIFYNIKAKPSMLYSTLRFMDLYNKSNNQNILNQ